MKLRIGPEGLETIRASADAIVLGIILVDGLVLLRVGDALRCPGHRAWMHAERPGNVVGGFSLLVRDGRVRTESDGRSTAGSLVYGPVGAVAR